MRYLILLLSLCFLQSCVDKPETLEKLSHLKKENDSLKLLVKSLSNTAENRFIRASEILANGQDSIALLEFKKLIEQTPLSPYAESAKKTVDNIEKRLNKRKLEDKRQRH